MAQLSETFVEKTSTTLRLRVEIIKMIVLDSLRADTEQITIHPKIRPCGRDLHVLTDNPVSLQLMYFLHNCSPHHETQYKKARAAFKATTRKRLSVLTQ
jgi:hypothetical protein